MQRFSKMLNHISHHIPNHEGYYPFLTGVLAPVVLSLGIWAVLPTGLRRMHEYTESSATILHHNKKRENPVPFDLSVWASLEDPCRTFATFLVMSQLGGFIAPTTFAARYVSRIWSGGSVACLIWFLHRWKKNVITRFLKDRQISQSEKERYLTLDQISTICLICVGALGLSEASGVAVQSLLTVGGIGGVATAFAARDVLGNILSGISLIFSKPFSTGDFIKAGDVVGKVEEVGLHSTRLLNTDKNPVVVPNSFFSSVVIVNMSRAPFKMLTVKVPVKLQDFEKMNKITAEVRKFLSNNPVVYMGEDKPRCSVSQIGPAAIEIIITANMKQQSAEEYYQSEQDIMIETARIVTKHGAVLGGFV